MLYVDAKSIERNEAYEFFSAACYGSAKRDASHCPRSIAITNRMTPRDPEARAANAGPGHKPASPQPTPKITAPSISGGSTCVLIGKRNCAASNGFDRRKITGKIGIVTASAPAITSKRVGSQRPATSRKPITLAGLIISETAKPKAKIIPTTNAAAVWAIRIRVASRRLSTPRWP